jgi:cytochrome c oxidase assembly protein subunit 11
LKPGEVKEMVVRFEVDKDLPEEVTALTLSYTFFRAKKVAVN